MSLLNGVADLYGRSSIITPVTPSQWIRSQTHFLSYNPALPVAKAEPKLSECRKPGQRRESGRRQKPGQKSTILLGREMFQPRMVHFFRLLGAWQVRMGGRGCGLVRKLQVP